MGAGRLTLICALAMLTLQAPAAAAAEHGVAAAEAAIDREADRVVEAVDEDDAQAAHGGGHEAGGHEAHGEEPPPPINWADFGYRSKDVHDGTLAPGDEPMPPQFVLALLNFAIFAGLLIKFAGPKLKGYLAGRHDAIKRDLAEAARLRAEAEARLAQYAARMAKVNGEVDQLIREIQGEAEAEKAQVLADAARQAEALRRDAEERIASEIGRARAELEREIVAVAIAAAEKVLREQTSAGDQQALFEGFLDNLSSRGQGPPGGAAPPPAGDDSVSKGWS